MDNRCRFDGRASGHYEVWFVTLNDPQSGYGLWFRYALDVPVGRTTPEPSVWAIVFPGAGVRPFGIIRRDPAGAWPSSDGVIAGAANDALYASRLRGSLDDGTHAIAWDLAFEPAAETFEHVDPAVRRAVRPKTLICAPNLAVAFSGSVTIDGRRLDLERAPGCQQHIWGSKHANGWAWAHCNAFDGEPDAVFEGIAARPGVGPVTLPPLTIAYLRTQDAELRLNGLRHVATSRSREEPFEWQFVTGDGRSRVRGTAHSSAERFVQVEYVDPDGEKLYCLNTEIGDLELVVERRAGRFGAWEPAQRLVSRGTTHFELASRRRRDDVPLL